MQIVDIANWCTWLVHTLCKGLIWNYKNCWAQPWFSFGSWKRFDEVENISVIFFLTDTGFCSEILKYALFFFSSLVWWYTLMKNKHQISLYLGLKKMTNILQITFSNGFSFLKNDCLSVCLSVFLISLSLCLCLSHLFHYVPIMVSSWNFQEWLPMTEMMSMQKFKVWGQKSKLQRSKPKLAVSGP